MRGFSSRTVLKLFFAVLSVCIVCTLVCSALWIRSFSHETMLVLHRGQPNAYGLEMKEGYVVIGRYGAAAVPTSTFRDRQIFESNSPEGFSAMEAEFGRGGQMVAILP